MANAPDAPATRKPRWYAPTPAKFLFAVLVMQGVFCFSTNYHWFWFNERKGYTVLITVAATAIALLLLATVVLVSWFFRSKAQFGLSTMLLIVMVMAIPLAWLGRDMHVARQQEEVMEMDHYQWLQSRMHQRYSDQQIQLAWSQQPSQFSVRCREIENRLHPLLGEYFFRDVAELRVTRPVAFDKVHLFHQLEMLQCLGAFEVDLARLRGLNRLKTLEFQSSRLVHTRLEPLRELAALENLGLIGMDVSNEDLEPLTQLKQLKHLRLSRTAVTDAGLVHLSGLTQLQHLDLWGTQVTDRGLDHLAELPQLRSLELQTTQVTAEGVLKLRSALPNCSIVH
jgi:hypothetical protein